MEQIRLWFATSPLYHNAKFLYMDPVYPQYDGQVLLTAWRAQIYINRLAATGVTYVGQPIPPELQLQLLHVRTGRLLAAGTPIGVQGVGDGDVLVLLPAAADSRPVEDFMALIAADGNAPCAIKSTFHQPTASYPELVRRGAILSRDDCRPPAPPPTVPVRIFISYAREDRKALERIKTALAVLREQGYIADWHDRLIAPGDAWADQIDAAMRQADLFLLLLSPDFFASAYINHVELAEALRRHDAGTARVIPIVLRPCQWKLTHLGRLQVLPTDGKPAGSRDEAFLDIADGIARVVMAKQPVS